MLHGNNIWHRFEYVSDRSQFSRNKNESFKPNCYDFKKLSVLGQTISFFYNDKNVFSTILKAVWNVKVFLILWFTHPVLKEYILT